MALITESVTVQRRIERDGVVIVECATATLADDLVLDDLTEALRRSTLANSLFSTLPSVAEEREAAEAARLRAQRANHGQN